MTVYKDLGVPLAEEKLEGPVKSIQFLGFILDTVRMEIRLPESKLSSLSKLLEEWTGRKSCLKNDLEQLLGKLSHACVVIPNGRIFLRRMYNLLGTVSKGYYFLRLNQGFRSDLAWWSCFCQGVMVDRLRIFMMHLEVGAVVPCGMRIGCKEPGQLCALVPPTINSLRNRSWVVTSTYKSLIALHLWCSNTTDVLIDLWMSWRSHKTILARLRYIYRINKR